ERLCACVDPRDRREFEGRAIHGPGTLRFSIRMDDTSSKGSAQGKESVADEQGAQAHLSRVTISSRRLSSTAADDPIGQARGSAFLQDVPRTGVGPAFCLAP